MSSSANAASATTSATNATSATGASKHRLGPAVLAKMDASAAEQYELAPVGFVCMSVDGWIGKLNKALLDWTGYRRDEIVGQMRFQDLIGAGARIFFDTHHAPLLLMQGYVNEIAINLRARDGSLIPVLVNSVLTRDEDGRPLLIRMSIFNASERRRYERELLHAKRQAEHAAVMLEQRVNERTSLLADALAQAEAAVRAKDDFLANMSHEIRTPLNCILGMAGLASEHAHDPVQRDYLAKITHSGHQMLSIVGAILDFCKLGAGKLQLEQLPIDLHQVITDAAAGFVGMASEKGLDLQVRVDPALQVQVLGDALRLGQVLGNYIGNAIKFTARGRIDVHARLAACEPDRMRVRIEVHDSGIGLTQLQQQNLFQPFYQADSSTTRKYGGTGLGLAICREIAGMMDGAVGVISAPGEGSTFWFELRLPYATPAPAPSAAAPAFAVAPGAVATPDAGLPSIEQAMARLKGKRLLLAEDNLLNQELTRILVERAGAELTVAANGADALAALADASFDCVLMDVQMPVMDGCTATRHLRGDIRLDGLPVIAMTANAFDSTRDGCLAAGMDDFLVKPIESALFYRTVARWIDGRGQSLDAAHAALADDGVDALADDESSETISLSVLAALVDNDPDTMKRLLRIFLDNAASTIVELQAALAAGRLDELNLLGHRLKSSARAVGATPIAENCRALEDLLTLDGAEALVAPLDDMLAALRRELAARSALGLGQAALLS